MYTSIYFQTNIQYFLSKCNPPWDKKYVFLNFTQNNYWVGCIVLGALYFQFMILPSRIYVFIFLQLLGTFEISVIYLRRKSIYFQIFHELK